MPDRLGNVHVGKMLLLMKGFLHRNGLLLVTFFVLFLGFLSAQTLTGQREYNDEQEEHGEAPVELLDYLGTGHWREATFENFESEFLQMGAYVLLTVWLRQKGSSESKPLDESTPQDEDPKTHRDDPDAPWAVRKGGVALSLYKNSLSIAFFALFAVSFLVHANGGLSEHNTEQLAHGGATTDVWGFMRTAEFWFQSFQNWQSEFLAVAAIVFLSIYLRQRGSPESKPVHAPHAETGS
jgi:hypothetical protein